MPKKEAFKDVKIIRAYEQPLNLIHLISNSSFISGNKEKLEGLFKCTHKSCKICKLYIQEGSSFVTSNGSTWHVKCYANCNSLNVIYYLTCNFCSETTYTGKSDDLRQRTNGHISDIKHNRGGNFDGHVRNCALSNNKELLEPFFELRVFMVLKDYNRLLDYEAKLHAKGYDNMKR